ncbi:MAG: RagB/SusD family nutrient uptake outer membrane protein [Bacteroides sp.]|nr:RagB/SusD family nutrient uptake outer membrane protein [Bacteroides sp.]
MEEYQLLFPIPDSEVDLNPSMSQNPGYNLY